MCILENDTLKLQTIQLLKKDEKKLGKVIYGNRIPNDSYFVSIVPLRLMKED